MSVPINPNIKADILKSIREEGMGVREASKVFGVSENTIRNWLYRNTKGSDKNLILENNMLKKKLANAYRVIGELTAEVKRPKG